MSAKLLVPAIFAGLLAGCSAFGTHPAGHDFIVTAAKPGQLFVVDPRKMKVVSDFAIPGAHDSVSTIVTSPDGTIAYVLVNRARSIAGINLRTGKQVFRANLSAPGERVQCMAFDVTPDGKTLIVYEYRTHLGIDSYTVETPQFALFSTAAGAYAMPERTFPAPRRIQAVLARKDGRSFYALWPDVYEFDLRTGQLLGKRGLLHWGRADHSSADLSINSPASEPTGVFVAPLYSTLTGSGLPTGGVSATSLMTLNLHTGKLAYHDISRTAPPIFATILSPNHRWAFGVFDALFKIDARHWRIVKQVPVPHSFYMVDISSNGKEVYLGGNMCDIAVYDTSSLRQRGDIRLPGCGDQALVTPRIIERR